MKRSKRLEQQEERAASNTKQLLEQNLREARLGVRELWHAVSRSLTARCLAVAGVYVAAMALVITGISLVAEQHVASVAVGVNAVEPNEDAIFNGDYDALTSPMLKGCESLVLDENGVALYASSTEFAQAIRPSDLDFIGSYDEYGHYIVFEEFFDNTPRYRVMGTGMDPETGMECITSYALLDADLNIIEGNLFSNRSRLTTREFGLLLGIYDPDGAGLVGLGDGDSTATELSVMEDESSEGYRISGILTENQYVINKFIGVNDAGEPRAIVFAVPTTTGAAYRRAADEAQRFWWVLVPVGGVATVLMLWAEVRIIRSATMPLSRAIAGYGEKREVHLERDAVATELRPVLDGFVALTDDLERSQAEKQRMIADISHDVKTPLTVIRGYAQAFRDGMVPPERTQAFAQALCDKAEIASNMVEALGTYAATEHPDYHAERVDCDLTAVLRTIAEGLKPTVAQHGGTFSCEIPEGPVPARLDEELLRRALTNLAVNACVHNDAGVAVAMRCHVDDAPGSGRVATLQVLDNGRGIDPALVEHVFDPFVTSNVARQVGKGTGLGLSIARRCVEFNGGAIELSCAPEPWSTCFTITLKDDAA